MLSIGSHAGNRQHERINESTSVKFSSVLNLKGQRKDHKPTKDPNIGPPCRPLCNARLGPNSTLGNLIARTIRPVKTKINEINGTEVLSTEEMLAGISEVNKKKKFQLNSQPLGRTNPPHFKITTGWYSQWMFQHFTQTAKLIQPAGRLKK